MTQFTVALSTMTEAGKEIYFVSIDQPTRPITAAPWDSGRMDVFKTFIKEHAELERDYWVDFLNVDLEDDKDKLIDELAESLRVCLQYTNLNGQISNNNKLKFNKVLDKVLNK